MNISTHKDYAVYAIRNVINNKIYIGSTINLRSRERLHKRDLQKGTHHAKHMQRAWDYYGSECFEFYAIEYTAKTKEALLASENYWIKHFGASNQEKGYNSSPTAGNNLGFRYKQTESFKQKCKIRASEQHEILKQDPEKYQAFLQNLSEGLKKYNQNVSFERRQEITGAIKLGWKVKKEKDPEGHESIKQILSAKATKRWKDIENQNPKKAEELRNFAALQFKIYNIKKAENLDIKAAHDTKHQQGIDRYLADENKMKITSQKRKLSIEKTWEEIKVDSERYENEREIRRQRAKAAKEKGSYNFPTKTKEQKNKESTRKKASYAARREGPEAYAAFKAECIENKRKRRKERDAINRDERLKIRREKRKTIKEHKSAKGIIA